MKSCVSIPRWYETWKRYMTCPVIFWNCGSVLLAQLGLACIAAVAPAFLWTCHLSSFYWLGSRLFFLLFLMFLIVSQCIIYLSMVSLPVSWLAVSVASMRSLVQLPQTLKGLWASQEFLLLCCTSTMLKIPDMVGKFSCFSLQPLLVVPCKVFYKAACCTCCFLILSTLNPLSDWAA